MDGMGFTDFLHTFFPMEKFFGVLRLRDEDFITSIFLFETLLLAASWWFSNMFGKIFHPYLGEKYGKKWYNFH